MARTVTEVNDKINQIISKYIEITGKQLEKDFGEKYARAVENSNNIHEWIRKE